jgi:hypothetical protein
MKEIRQEIAGKMVQSELKDPVRCPYTLTLQPSGHRGVRWY